MTMTIHNNNNEATTTTTAKTSSTYNSSSSSSSSSSTHHPCQVCGKDCRKRCTQCRAVYYCSVACQKQDWKSHRSVCGQRPVVAAAATATTAWNELTQLVASCDLSKAQQEYCNATDQIELQLEKQKQQQKQQHVKQQPSEEEKKVDNDDSSPPFVDATKTRKLYGDNTIISYIVEDMPNLSCYQLLLYCKNEYDDDDDINNTAATAIMESISIQLVSPHLLSIHFHRKPEKEQPPECLSLKLLHPCSDCQPPRQVQLLDQGRLALSVRLAYNNNSNNKDYYCDPCYYVSTRTMPHVPQQLACRACGQELFASVDDTTGTTNTNTASKTHTRRLQKVLPLPSGQWQDMEEFLSCSGEPGLLSTPDTVPDHVLWQDATALVLHAQHVVPTAVCVLAIPPPYGSNSSSSSRNEKDDDDNENDGYWKPTDPGLTLTCSCCASILGSVTGPDTFRLWQHQLLLTETTEAPTSSSKATISKVTKSVASLAQFVAGELIRYADAHAIFGFFFEQAYDHDATNTNTATTGSTGTARRACLLQVQLVSWENAAAHSRDSHLKGYDEDGDGNNETGHYHVLEWRRQVKVYFEQKEVSEDEDVGDANDLSSLWNNTDWCCPPASRGGVSSQKNSTTSRDTNNEQQVKEGSTSPSPGRQGQRRQVRLRLSPSEWEELRDELVQASGLQDDAVVEATILAKTGKSLNKETVMGIAVIAL